MNDDRTLVRNRWLIGQGTVRIRALVVIVLLLSAPVQGAAQTADATLAQVAKALEAKVYKQVAQTLAAGIKESSVSITDRARLILALASFYRDQAGDTARARTWFKKITSNPAYRHLKAFHQANIAMVRMDQALKANPELHRLYLHARTLVMKPGASFTPKDSTRLEADLSKLGPLLHQACPDYPVYNIYYLMGMIHLKQNQPFRADRAFGKALELRPALYLTLPVKRLKQNARYQWTRHLGNLLVLGAGLGLIVTIAAGFALTRPWQWVQWRHLVSGVVLLLVWSGWFWGALHLFGGLGNPGQIVNKDAFFPPPAYVDFRYNAPGAEPAWQLFAYGTTLVAGVYFLCMFTQRMKKAMAAFVVNLMGAGLGTISVLGFFYLHHVDFKSRYYAGSNDPGYFAFRISEPEPYLLTNPLNYPVIELDAVEDPQLVKWLKRYQ